MPRQIVLHEVRYGPKDVEKAKREVPAEALANGSIWILFVGFASDVDAPDT
jgi:hypothetical protein